MSKPTPDDGIEFDFEFDAPQWTDLQIEKEKLEEDSWSPDKYVCLYESGYKQLNILEKLSMFDN